MSDTSYDCYYEKHFALHSLSGVKIVLLKCYRTLVDKYLEMFLVCKKLIQPVYSSLFIPS